MRSNRLHLVTTALASLVFFSCTRETEEFKTTPLSQYFPLQVGKYITYRLDSTVFTAFGANTEVHSYQEKHVIDAELTDAQGRKTYRIFRFLRDTAGTLPWAPTGTYSVTPTDSVIEVNENNLRFIKLVLPVTQDNVWRGNRFLPINAFGPLYSFDNDLEMDDWDYTYSSVDGSLTAFGKTYTDVVTVDAINEALYADLDDFTVTDPSAPIAYVNYLQEQYAKGIGLVGQRFVMWEFQHPNGSQNPGAKVGFGVRRLIIDHN